MTSPGKQEQVQYIEIHLAVKRFLIYPSLRNTRILNLWVGEFRAFKSSVLPLQSVRAQCSKRVLCRSFVSALTVVALRWGSLP